MSEQFDFLLAKETLQNAPFGILVIDKHQHIVWLNKTCVDVLNIDSDRLIGKSVAEISLNGFKSVIDTNDGIFSTKSRQCNERWFKCWRQPLQIDNASAGSSYFLMDITDSVKLREEFDRINNDLEAKSTRDPLTGLLNRRGLMQVLEAQVSRSRRYNNPLSLMRMKIAGYEYREGPAITKDQVLMAIGHLLHDQLRWADITGRLDDEDFLIILPETEDDATKKLAEKIKAQLEDLRIGRNEQKMMIKMCFGITSWVKGDDQGKLLERTEQAMTAAATRKKILVET